MNSLNGPFIIVSIANYEKNIDSRQDKTHHHAFTTCPEPASQPASHCLFTACNNISWHRHFHRFVNCNILMNRAGTFTLVSLNHCGAEATSRFDLCWLWLVLCCQNGRTAFRKKHCCISSARGEYCHYSLIICFWEQLNGFSCCVWHTESATGRGWVVLRPQCTCTAQDSTIALHPTAQSLLFSVLVKVKHGPSEPSARSIRRVERLP